MRSQFGIMAEKTGEGRYDKELEEGLVSTLTTICKSNLRISREDNEKTTNLYRRLYKLAVCRKANWNKLTFPIEFDDELIGRLKVYPARCQHPAKYV
jgi:hypothetical protein